ncbi:MAG TPA: septum formation family protein [Candidatus Limnocylindria bacterium]
MAIEGRWVCRRCFNANEPDATACTSCGLARGAEPSASDGGYAQAAPADGRGGPLRLLGRFWWIGLVVVIAIGGWWFGAKRDDAGNITGSGDLQVADLRIGDCFDLKEATATEVEKVTARPCADEHEFELFHDGNVDVDGYPGDAAFEAWVANECLPAFAPYVGVAYEASLLEFSYFVPSEDGWDQGDHSVQCVLYDPNEANLTESMRGAAR